MHNRLFVTFLCALPCFLGYNFQTDYCSSGVVLSDGYGFFSDGPGFVLPSVSCSFIIQPLIPETSLSLYFFDVEICFGLDTLSIQRYYNGTAVGDLFRINGFAHGALFSFENFTDPLDQVLISFSSNVNYFFTGFIGGYYTDSYSQQVMNDSACIWSNSCSGNGYCSNGSCICNVGYRAMDCHNEDLAFLNQILSQADSLKVSQTTNWLENDNICEWTGILCYANHRIDLVDIPSIDLTGFPTVWPIFAESFSFSANKIQGSLPFDDWYNVGINNYLVKVDFGNNQISGGIPSSIGYFGYLTFLDLSNNNIVGTLPSTINNLRGISALKLNQNNISGLLNLPIFEVYPQNSVDVSGNSFNCPVPNFRSLIVDGCWNLTILSVYPDYGNVIEESFVTITSNRLDMRATYTCLIGSNSANATVIDESTLQCILPIFLSHGEIKLYIGDENFQPISTNYIPFTYQPFCSPNTFLSDSKTSCIACPLEAKCLGGINSPLPLPNYFSSNISPRTVFISCLNQEACNRNEEDLDDKCAVGYSGYLCSVCEYGYQIFNVYCEKCWSHSILIGLNIVFIVCLISVGIAVNNLVIFSDLQIWLNFLQLFFVILAYPIQTDDTFRKVFGSNIFLLDLDILGLDCLLGVERPVISIIAMLSPFISFASFFIYRFIRGKYILISIFDSFWYLMHIFAIPCIHQVSTQLACVGTPDGLFWYSMAAKQCLESSRLPQILVAGFVVLAIIIPSIAQKFMKKVIPFFVDIKNQSNYSLSVAIFEGQNIILSILPMFPSIIDVSTAVAGYTVLICSGIFTKLQVVEYYPKLYTYLLQQVCLFFSCLTILVFKSVVTKYTSLTIAQIISVALLSLCFLAGLISHPLVKYFSSFIHTSTVRSRSNSMAKKRMEENVKRKNEVKDSLRKSRNSLT